MGSHLLEVLRQGIWASLTGGWFHDPRQPLFINTVHLYLWLFLTAFPLTLCIYFTSTPTIWSLYCGTVGVLFLVVKLINSRFHYLFDTTEPVPEPEKESAAAAAKTEGVTTLTLATAENTNSSRSHHVVGLNEPEGIELQDMSSIGRPVVSSRLRNPSFEEAEHSTGANLKVDVHRNESSSSDSSRSSVSSQNTKFNSGNSSCHRDSALPNCVETLETVVVHDQARIANERNLLSTEEEGNDEKWLGEQGQVDETQFTAETSNVSAKQLPGALSLDSICQENQDCGRKTTLRLKETTSLELGNLLSSTRDEFGVKTTQFRRTRSAGETLSDKTIVNSPVLHDAICTSTSDAAGMQSPPRTLGEENRTATTAVVYDIGSPFVENKSNYELPNRQLLVQESPSDAKGNDSESRSDSDDGDEQTRSRTPLLARPASQDQKSTKDPKRNVGENTGHGQGKRVSFSTRSLDGNQHYYHQHHKGRTNKQYDISRDRDNRFGKERRRKGSQSKDPELRTRQIYQRSESASDMGNAFRQRLSSGDRGTADVPSSVSADNVEESALTETRFALIPQNDSMVGWNLAGGPFSSQWMFQAVNVAVQAITGSACGSTEGLGVDDDQSESKILNCDADSITSGDSATNHSLTGLNWLFSSNNDLSQNNSSGTTDETVVTEESLLGADETISPILEDLKVGGVSKRPLMLQGHGVNPNSGRKGSTSRRGDRETSPRVLERLLEETLEPCPSSSGSFGRGIITVPEDSGAASGSGRRRGSGRHRRGSGDSPVPSGGTPFLHAARELKLQLRSIGQQNTLDISGPFAYTERHTGMTSRNNMQGTFRPREETVHGGNIDFIPGSNAIAVNRHRRLMRLTNSRRSLERRREVPVMGSGGGTASGSGSAGGTHVANSHDDTSEGAVHYFQDERGHWHSYTFAEKPYSSHSGGFLLTDGNSQHFSPTGAVDKISNSLHRSYAGASSSGDAGQSCQVPCTHTLALKTPSSSESWSSGSSTELAVDATANKMYTAYRRTNSQPRVLMNSSHNQSRNHSQTDSGCPSPVTSVPSLVTITPEYNSVSASTSSQALNASRLPMPSYTSMQRSWQRNRRDVLQVLTESIIERRRMPGGAYGSSQDHSYHSAALGILGSGGDRINSHNRGGLDRANKQRQKKLPPQYYNMKLLYFVPKSVVKIWFDRLTLMALFDSNLSMIEALFSILLATGVASLGAYMLHQQYYRDLSAVLLCLVMASCQFSLLKSVQPDASSPTHGFNRIVAFSRPIYFCLCSGGVYLLQNCIDGEVYDLHWTIYEVDLTQKVFITTLRDALLVLILSFPVLFSIGIFPQFNTFTMYLLEQIDMHGFGGNAASGVVASFVGVCKSSVAVALLYGFCYGAMSEEKTTQHLMFSIFIGLIVPLSYHMSRCTSDTSVLWSVLKQTFCTDEDCFGEPHQTTPKQQDSEEQGDPLPKKLKDTVTARLKSDGIICTVIGLVMFGLHSSTVFSALQPGLTPTLWILAIALGFLLHYLVPQFRKQLPCLLVSRPILPPAEYHQFEVRDAARLMWFEKIYILLCFFEKNIVYPLLFTSALTQESAKVTDETKFGVAVGSLIIVVAALKAFRTSFSDPGKHYLILFFTLLFFNFDWTGLSETFLVDLFFMNIAFHKVYELWLKLQFVITYIAPWQITWGSAFHAFAQPFSVPHSAMLFLQAIVSSVLSAPLNPFLGSAIFITSYVRPIKFWEKDYNTKRVDHSNTRLSTHLEKNPGADDNNLNSIFYEHLTRSLQDCLCGDLMLGRWGQVAQGDCFVLASDYLNCLVHVIEIGNGLVTFQVRGLEFRGTYCQQREVEAISEGVEDDDGFCCCEPGHPPHMLSVNSAFSQRWLAWEVTVSKYVLEGYSISDNSAVSMLQVYDLRKILITYYVKSIIYYAIKSEKLQEWLKCDPIVAALQPTVDKHYAELDPVFSANIDEDYDYNVAGVTRLSFCHHYLPWIQYCVSKREKSEDIECDRDSMIVSLCFALSILGRRALGIAAHSNALSSVEFFLYGLHALFKGDFRITCQRDEWVFCDMELLKGVVSAAVRMSLKLHQDHFMCPDEYDDHASLYDAVNYHDQHLVISHEGDPAWRSAVLSGTPALLALRHVLDDGTDEYKIIMLNKRHLSFRVIKLNRECVRGLWAGQQQELVYLRNRDPERGSIQNAKQALRNIINSSCDQPIGYPIYVSPLTTSYFDTHPQVCSIIGGPISLSKIRDSVLAVWRRIRLRVGEGCSSGSAITHEDNAYGHEGVYAMTSTTLPPAVSGGLNLSGSQSLDGSQIGGSSVSRGSLTRGNFNRGSVASNVSKPSTSTLASLAGFLTDPNSTTRDREKGERDSKERERDMRELSRDREKSTSFQKVRIVDANLVYDGLNMGRRIDVIWPDEAMRFRGGRSFWQNWVPLDGMEGVVVHKWIPSHRDPQCRSVTDKTILLLKIDDKYVPIAETGVVQLSPEL